MKIAALSVRGKFGTIRTTSRQALCTARQMLETTETLLKGLAAGNQNRWARFYRDYAQMNDTNYVGYAAYKIEPGGKLIFTDTDSYPQGLIEYL